MLSTKKIVNPGKADLPKFEDGVKTVFHYRVQRFKINDDGTREIVETIDDSRLPYPHGYGLPMEIVFGKKFKLPVWERCLETMREDEIAEFTLTPKEMADYPFVSKQLKDFSKEKNRFHKNARSGHEQVHEHDEGESSGPCAFSCMGMMAQNGLGYPELDALMTKPEPLIFTFHLLKVLQPNQYERESWTLTPEQKLESIPGLKTEGNQLFHEGRFHEAEHKYMEALGRLDLLVLREKPGEPEWKELDDLKIPFFANLAQIKLQQRDFYKAIEAATEVLRREPENTKALYRRAKALAGAWNLDEARRDLDKLRQVDPKCSNMADKELQIINELEKQSKSDESARCRNLFQ